VSSHLLSDLRAHLSVVKTSCVGFHEYFTVFKRSHRPFHNTHIIVQGFMMSATGSGKRPAPTLRAEQLRSSSRIGSWRQGVSQVEGW
jgi:hypothetical protein